MVSARTGKSYSTELGNMQTITQSPFLKYKIFLPLNKTSFTITRAEEIPLLKTLPLFLTSILKKGMPFLTSNFEKYFPLFLKGDNALYPKPLYL